MIKFYSNHLSNNCRRVWITLLEKKLDFETIELKLDGDQFEPDFLSINPFHQIPVLVNNDLTVLESLAIMDYLEAQYPEPALLPKSPPTLAKVKTIELININHLVNSVDPLLRQKMSLSVKTRALDIACGKINSVLNFYEDNLQEDSYFIAGQFTLADIVAGVSVSFLDWLDFPLNNYPKVENWLAKLQQRDSWQQSKLTSPQIEAERSRIVKILRSREITQKQSL